MFKEKWKAVKKHVKRNRTFYVAVGCSIVTAGITYFIMRDRNSQDISVGNVSDAASCGIVSVSGKNVANNTISLISANRKGSPSWVVRCIDTDEVFTSQHKAANALNIPQKELSQHLNGQRDAVRDLHFERICMAAT